MTNPTTPAPSPSTPATPSPPMVKPHPKAAVSVTEAAQLAAWAKEDYSAGKITQAQLEAQFAELNTPQADRNTTDTRSPEQRQLDTLHPPAKDSEYTIRYGLAGQAMPMTPELKQFDQSARAWLSGAEFDRMTGNSLVTTIDRVAHQVQHMTPGQLEFYADQQYALLERTTARSSRRNSIRPAGWFRRSRRNIPDSKMCSSEWATTR